MLLLYFADQPSFQSGNYVKNIRVVFEKGVAIKVEAEEGEEEAAPIPPKYPNGILITKAQGHEITKKTNARYNQSLKT